MDEREQFRAYAIWAFTLSAISSYWVMAEAAAPGRQYADPALPTLYCSLVIGIPLYALDLVGRTARSGLRQRRRTTGSSSSGGTA